MNHGIHLALSSLQLTANDNDDFFQIITEDMQLFFFIIFVIYKLNHSDDYDTWSSIKNIILAAVNIAYRFL